MKKTTKVEKGMTFRYVYCDGNCLWRVVRPKGTGVWLCVIDKEDLDYAGHEDVFTEERILDLVNRANLFAALMSDHDAYYASLKPGSIVHYEDARNRYIRCEAVNHEGQTKLKRIALVGQWPKYDLPRYNPRTFELEYCYHAEKIENGEVFDPNYTCIYECDHHHKSENTIDPRTLPPINLKLPPLTAHQVTTRDLWRACNDIAKHLNHPAPDMLAGEVLESAKAMIDAAFAKV